MRSGPFVNRANISSSVQELQKGDRRRIHRALVVDDNAAIHEDFRKILARRDDGLEDIEADLFGEEQTTAARDTFEIDSALQGQEGLEMVQRAILELRPYELAFVDLHMPPGLDGIETIAGIWRMDSEIQVVLCAACMKYTWDEVVLKLGRSDGLAILKKPFEPDAVLRLAKIAIENRCLQGNARLALQA